MDGRRPSRKIFTNPSVCRRTRRNCHHFSTISAQEMIEKRSRTPRTTLATGPAFQRISRIPVFKESGVGTRAPSGLFEGYASTIRSELQTCQTFDRTSAGLAGAPGVDLAGARPV